VLKELNRESGIVQLGLETISVHQEGGVLFADIASPPMNLLGPELVRDLVSLIQQAEADDTVQILVFKSADPDQEMQLSSWPPALRALKHRTTRPKTRRSEKT